MRVETTLNWRMAGKPNRPARSSFRAHGRWLFLLMMGLNIVGLAGGTTPSRIINPTSSGPAWPTEEEESHPTGKAKSETVAVEHRRHHRHEALYRLTPGGTTIEYAITRSLDRPTRVPSEILAEFDLANGLGAPLLC